MRKKKRKARGAHEICETNKRNRERERRKKVACYFELMFQYIHISARCVCCCYVELRCLLIRKKYHQFLWELKIIRKRPRSSGLQSFSRLVSVKRALERRGRRRAVINDNFNIIRSMIRRQQFGAIWLHTMLTRIMRVQRADKYTSKHKWRRRQPLCVVCVFLLILERWRMESRNFK
jgi:hypothetical protein